MASTQVFLNGSVYSPADPFATAMVVNNGSIEWVGQDAGARSILDSSMECIDLEGKLVTPAFALAAASVQPAQVTEFLDSLSRAGYVSANLTLTEPAHKLEVNSGVDVRLYLPVSSLNALQSQPGSISGVYSCDPAELTEECIRLAATNRLNLVAVPSSNAEAEEFIELFERLDPVLRSRVSPRLDGMTQLELSLIHRAKDCNIALGFSSFADHTENSYSSALAAGASAMLGSDPLTAPQLMGWELINQAVNPTHPESAVSARAAFQSMTRAVYRSQGEANPWCGQLVPGAPAHYALWNVTELMVQTPDSRISAWSTDPRARTPLLPVLADDVVRPELVALYAKTGQLNRYK